MRKFIEDQGIFLLIDPDMEEKSISCDETEIERWINSTSRYIRRIGR